VVLPVDGGQSARVGWHGVNDDLWHFPVPHFSVEDSDQQENAGQENIRRTLLANHLKESKWKFQEELFVQVWPRQVLDGG
jgi:hypothetical protein